jgi:hypothetical protein
MGSGQPARPDGRNVVSGSTIKALIPALTALWAGAGIADLQVSDGPIYDPENAHLIVGWNGGQSAPIAAHRDIADGARARDRESYDVACLLSYQLDDATVAEVRDALLDAFDALDAAIHGTPRLGVDGVARAWISEYQIDPDIYETGEWVCMPLTVHVEAWK